MHGDHAILLFESGETAEVPVTALPAPAEWPLAGSSVRSSPGRLLELAVAIRAQRIKHRWNPDTLEAAAVATAQDQVTVRLTALDALALGLGHVLASLRLTTSERTWLAAVRAASAGDGPGLVAAVTALPPEGYRAKVTLLLKGASSIDPRATDISGLDAQLRPLLAEMPVAGLLHRAFGLAGIDADDGTAARAADARLLAAGVRLPEGTARTIETAAACIVDEISPDASDMAAVAEVGPAVRTVAALRRPGARCIRSGDIARLPGPLIDDLIDADSLDVDTAMAAPADAELEVYLRGRLAPARLTDEELVALGHGEERARRAFPLPDPESIERLGDSPLLRHFRALALVRLNRGTEVDLDDVDAGGRPTVAGLLRAIDASVSGESVMDALGDDALLDPTVWPVLTSLIGPAALQPSAELAQRFPAFCEWLALHRAREHLFLGDWSAAVDAADRCLALATGERVRDEALNLKACGLHHLGDGSGAVAALEEAIAGAYSDALLANIGVVAATLRPDVAATYLGRLMVEAPTTTMRAAAGRRAVAIWSTSDTESWQTSDGSKVPDAVRDPLRSLITADIGLDDFRAFAALLAVQDAAWFAKLDLAPSPHSTTLEARFYQARARALDSMIDVMGEAIRNGTPPAWLMSERNSLRDAVVEVVMGDIDDPDSTLGPIALTMREAGVLEGDYDPVLFAALGLASIAYHLSEAGEEVADRLVRQVQWMRREWTALDGDDRRRVEPVVELATRRVAINRMLARDRELSDAIDTYNTTITRVRAGAEANPLTRLRAIHEVARAARQDIEPWLPLIEVDSVREGLHQTVATARELEERCRRFV